MLKRTKSVLPSIAIPLVLLLGAVGTQSQHPALLPYGFREARLPALMVYDFNLGMGPAGNVDHVAALGFEGLVTRVESSTDLLRLDQYAAHVDTLDDFVMFAFVAYNFSNPANSQVWRDALPTLASLDAPLWVIVRNSPSPDDLRALLADMAAESQAAGVEAVIYPHWDTDIESAEEATALILQVGHPNLKNSLHTCHEIRSGNQYDLDGVVAMHADVSALATIAGADANAYFGPPLPSVDWSDAIKPLDVGDFSLLPFLQELHDSGYDGPIVLHTFGITNDPGHLERSLRKYAEYVDQVTP